MTKSYTQKELRRHSRQQLVRISMREIDELFAEACADGTSHERLKAIARKVQGLIGFMSAPVNWYRLYRGRRLKPGEPRLEHVSQLLAPKPELRRIELGRCNLEGQSVLYTAVEPHALPSECRVEIGDRLTVVQFNRRDGIGDSLFYATHYGIDFELLYRGDPNYRDTGMREWFGSQYGKRQHIDEKMHRAFILSDGPNPYGLSAHLCAAAFFEHPKVDGIVYPSVATADGAKNVVIRPSSLKKVFYPAKVTEYLVTGQGHLQRSDGATISADGTLVWGSPLNLDPPVGVAMNVRSDYFARDVARKYIETHGHHSIHFAHPEKPGSGIEMTVVLERSRNPASFEVLVDSVPLYAGQLPAIPEPPEGQYKYFRVQTPGLAPGRHKIVCRLLGDVEGEIVCEGEVGQ